MDMAPKRNFRDAIRKLAMLGLTCVGRCVVDDEPRRYTDGPGLLQQGWRAEVSRKDMRPKKNKHATHLLAT